MSTDAPIRIGSRKSPLARAQTEWFARRLDCAHVFEWVQSGGDKDRTTDLQSFGATGIFTAELNRAVRDGGVDLAVHSLKDLPAADESGLVVACTPVREDTRDAWIARDGIPFADLPAGSRVGTGSPRRVAQLKRARPELEFVAIRGNVDTRIAHVTDGRVDAVVLAMAGLNRLGRGDVVTAPIEPELCVPAAGQGALGIVAREGDRRVFDALASVNDADVMACVTAERTALHTLGAGCHTPVGASAVVRDGVLHLHVRVLSLDGAEVIEDRREGDAHAAREIGAASAAALLDAGARPLVDVS